MTPRLQLQFIQNATKELPEGQQAVGVNTLITIPNSIDTLEFCWQNNICYLNLNNQLIQVSDGTLLKTEQNTIKVLLPANSQTPAKECLDILDDETIGASTTAEPKQHELDMLLQINSTQPELDFLFASNNVNPLTQLATSHYSQLPNLLLSGTDPISLLNQHFQPPIAKSITITSSTNETISNNYLKNANGDILHDLGIDLEETIFLSQNKYLSSLPNQHATIFSYQEDQITETKQLLQLTNAPIPITKNSLIKRLWHKYLATE